VNGPDQFQNSSEAPADDRDPRSAMLLRCDVIDALGRSFPCYVRNISRQGVSMRGCSGLRVGQALILALPVIGPIGGTVRWIDKDRFGVLLDSEIDPNMLRSGAVSVESAPRFQLLPQHQPMTDYRRPGLRPAN
jgi:hypothetical protein